VHASSWKGSERGSKCFSFPPKAEISDQFLVLSPSVAVLRPPHSLAPRRGGLKMVEFLGGFARLAKKSSSETRQVYLLKAPPPSSL